MQKVKQTHSPEAAISEVRDSYNFSGGRQYEP